MTTINYYEKNADDFYNNSINANMDEVADKFLGFIEKGGTILDAGCGSGRDTLYFLKHGYDVEAFDLSPSLASKASALTGIDVQVIGFLDLDKNDKYNGIWACASLLHLDGSEIGTALKKLITALKSDGILYASFKYGETSGERNGRYFTDMTEDKLASILKEFPDIEILELWQSEDVRPEKKGELWLNIFLRKQF